METDNPNSPPPTKSSHDTGSLVRAPRSMEDEDDADTTVPDDDNEETSLLSPANRLQPSSDRSARALLGAACSLMYQHVLEVEVIFDDHGVCSCTGTDSLVLERVVYEQRALVQPLPAALLLADKLWGIQFLLDLTVTCAFPTHTSEFALRIFDLTQVWSNRGPGIIEFDDLLALDGSRLLLFNLHFTQEKHPRSPPELLPAFAATCKTAASVAGSPLPTSTSNTR